MKREDLKALGLEDKAIDKVMALHGQTVNGLNAQIKGLETEKETLSEQVDQSSKQLKELGESNKDNQALQDQLKELQTANDQLQSENQAKLAETQKGFALELALRDAGARNVKAVLPFIDKDTIKLDGEKLIGLEEQLKSVKESNDFLFQGTESEETTAPEPKPTIVAGGNPNPGSNEPTDPFAAKMAKYE